MRQDKEQIENLKKEFEYLRSERAKLLPDWKRVQQFVSPAVFDWDNPQNKIPDRPRRFTTRPAKFAKTLKTGIIGYSISPNLAWFKLGFERQADTELYGAKDWLEAVERVMYAEFNRSNLYQQVSQFIDPAIQYGHGVMLIDEQLAENRLRFTAMKTQEIFLDTNEYGEADTVYRYFTMRLKDAAAFFGEESLPETWKVDLKNKERLNDEKTIIHAVYRRDAQIDSDSLGAKNKPYASVYLAEADEALLYEGGYDEFPYAVFRWEPLPGTAYSDSPSIQAYDDIWLLNKIDESRIKIAQLSSDPFYNVPDSMRGEEIKVVPSGFNYYTKPNEILAPVNVGANYNITLEIAQAIEDRVKDWFSVDFFLALQHQNVKDMTATAVMELQGEKAATLSDLIVNLNGALAKIIQRSFNLLWKQRKLPAPPPELAQSGAQLKIDFLGPLAQAQKKYHESAGIAQGISLIGAVAKVFGPSALAGIDEHQTLKAGLEGAGFPQNAIREDADRDAILQAQAQAQQQAAQQQAALEQQKNVLGNLNKLNEPVQPGSSLDQMNRQMGGGV